MILRKKQNQITFLHTFHHVSVLNIWWAVVLFIPGGQCLYSCWIHIVNVVKLITAMLMSQILIILQLFLFFFVLVFLLWDYVLYTIKHKVCVHYVINIVATCFKLITIFKLQTMVASIKIKLVTLQPICLAY